MGHGFARRSVRAIFHRDRQGRNGQLQAVDGDRLRDRFGAPRDVAFDQLRDGVHAGVRGHLRGNPDGQCWIHEHDLRHHRFESQAFLKRRIVTANDGVLGGFAAGAAGRGHGEHRQWRQLDVQSTSHTFQIICHAGAFAIGGHGGGGFCQIDGRAAADADEHVACRGAATGQFCRECIDVTHFGLVRNGGDMERFDAGSPQVFCQLGQCARFLQRLRAGDNECAAAQRGGQAADFAPAAPAEDDLPRRKKIVLDRFQGTHGTDDIIRASGPAFPAMARQTTMVRPMNDTIEITPAAGPVRGRIRPPGSKSITNRALVCAALAEGDSKLLGALESEDTRVMAHSLRHLEIAVNQRR